MIVPLFGKLHSENSYAQQDDAGMRSSAISLCLLFVSPSGRIFVSAQRGEHMITLFGPPEPTLLERLKDSVSKTKTELSAKVEQILTGDRPVDPELLKQLESALLSADIGVGTTKQVLAALRQQVNEHKLTESAALKQELKQQIMKILTAPAANSNGNRAEAAEPAPRVLFVVG